MIPAAALAVIPGCEDGRAPLVVQRLPGGRGVNDVLRVDTAQGRFVWRHRRPPIDRPGSRAMDEWRAQQLAAAAGLAPAILEAAPDASWLLMEFVDEPQWQPQDMAERIDALLAWLERLHALPVPADWPAVDAAGIARGYLAQLSAIAPRAVAALQPLEARIAEAGRELAALGERRSLVHGDLMASNILGVARPWLIDWEYAQVADPGWDIACLLTYYPHLAGQGGWLQAMDASDHQRLALQRERFALLNQLWEQVAAHGAG